MSAVQRRGALRVACFYLTVSESAVLIITGIISIGLLAQKLKLVYKKKAKVDTVTKRPGAVLWLSGRKHRLLIRKEDGLLGP